MSAILKLVPQERTCGKCGVIKPMTDFYKATAEKSGHNHMCKSCHAAWHRNRKEVDPTWNKKRLEDRNKSYWRNPEQKKKAYSRSISKRYGISLQEVEKILASQHGLCANRGCGVRIEFFVGKRSENQAVIDHCHTTDKVRGVLCAKCNLAIGHLCDSPNKALGIVEYLNKNKEL